MQVSFLDNKHLEHFNKMMEINNTPYNDRERVALFYILSSIDKFRRCPDEYYNFKTGMINSKALDGVLSDGELALLRLAYHLFTGRDDYKATVISTFYSLGREWSYIALNAIKLRFNIEDIEEIGQTDITKTVI